MVVLTIRDSCGRTWVTAHHSISKARKYVPPMGLLVGDLRYCLIEYEADPMPNGLFHARHVEGGAL